MDFDTRFRIEEEERVRHKARQMLENERVYGIEDAARLQGRIQQHGRLAVFLATLFGWLIGWTVVVFIAVIMDMVQKDWTTYWHDFGSSVSFIGYGYLILGMIGLWRAVGKAFS